MVSEMTALPAPGDTVSKRVTFDAGSIARWAAEAGDMNPLHHDPAFAATTRFGGVIASGAHMVAMLMGFGATTVSAMGEAVGLEFTYRFQRAMPAGTEATLSYTFLSADPTPKLGGTVLSFEGRITDDAGKVYVTSTGKAVVFDPRPAV
jgi:acyl dehydratase